MAATIGNLFINLRANSGPLRKGLKKSQGMVGRFGAGLRRMGGFAAASAKKLALIGAAAVVVGALIVKKMMSAIDELAKTASRLGMTVQQMRELKHAASIAGMEFKTLQKATQNMVKATAEAKSGLKTYTDAFDMLGLKADEVAEQTPVEMMHTFADALKGVESQTDKVLIAYRLFGGRGTQMLNMLQGGSAALQQQQEDFRKLGGVLTDFAASRVEAANDSITRFKAFLEGTAMIVTAHFAPAIEKVVTWIVEWVQEMGGAGTIGVNVFMGIAKAVAFVADIVQAVARGFEFMKDVALAAGGALVLFWSNTVAPALVAVLGLISEEWGNEAARNLEALKVMGEEMAAEGILGIEEALTKSHLNKWGDDVMGFAQALADEMEAALNATDAVDGLAEAHDGLNQELADATMQAAKYMDELDKQIRTFGMTKDAIQIDDFIRAGVDPKLIAQLKQRTALLGRMEAAAKAAGEPLDAKAAAKSEVDRAVTGASIETAIGAAKFAFGFTKNVEEEQLEEAEEQTVALRRLIVLGKQQYDVIRDTMGGLLQ